MTQRVLGIRSLAYPSAQTATDDSVMLDNPGLQPTVEVANSIGFLNERTPTTRVVRRLAVEI